MRLVRMLIEAIVNKEVIMMQRKVIQMLEVLWLMLLSFMMGAFVMMVAARVMYGY